MAELSREKFKVIGYDANNMETIVRPNITYWQDAWRRLKQNKVAMASMGVLIVLIAMVVFEPFFSRYPYTQQFMGITNNPPSAAHWFGTDQLGRDMFVRIWVGGRVSIAIGLIGTVVEVLFGTLYGGISAYLGGLVDDIMMRVLEVVVGLPYMIIVILITLVLGQGLVALIIALVLTGWTSIARIIRGQVLSLKESEYVLAAQALGADPGRVIMRHLLPNTIGVIIVYITFDIPGYIFAEAFLSFIGLGVQPPMTSWGAMAAFGQQQMMFYPHELLFPSLAIALTMLAFNLMGDGLRDALDPKLRQ